MKKLILLVVLCFCSLNIFAEQISYINQTISWTYLYDKNGKKYKTLSSSSICLVIGYSSSFFITQNKEWIYMFDSDGKKYHTMSRSSVGDVIGVSGETFTTIKNGWIYTFDKTGKKISTRKQR